MGTPMTKENDVPTESGAEIIGPLLTALHFAADKHRDQRRKDEEASPYINHPIEVGTSFFLAIGFPIRLSMRGPDLRRGPAGGCAMDRGSGCS